MVSHLQRSPLPPVCQPHPYTCRLLLHVWLTPRTFLMDCNGTSPGALPPAGCNMQRQSAGFSCPSDGIFIMSRHKNAGRRAAIKVIPANARGSCRQGSQPAAAVSFCNVPVLFELQVADDYPAHLP